MLTIPCRYYRVYTDGNVPCEERTFHHVERTLPIPTEEAALVLVDVWSTHYIDSWIGRAREIVETKIVPLLEAARREGMTVVHAPSPFVVEKRGYGASESASAPPHPRFERDWPPESFRTIYRSGEYAPFGRDNEPRLNAALRRYEDELDIADPVRPLPGEHVIATGSDLHRLLAERRILHLFYAGFATNWCVMYRDYGVIAMSERGYNIVLVRDATTGVEYHDTVETLAATDMAIREIETKHAWSTTTDAFIGACRQP